MVAAAVVVRGGEREKISQREKETEGEILQKASWEVIYIPQTLTMVVVWTQTDNRKRQLHCLERMWPPFTFRGDLLKG